MSAAVALGAALTCYRCLAERCMLMNEGRALLRQIEREVLAEGREFMRKRMAEKLAELDRRDGGLFPPGAGEPGAQAADETEGADAQRAD
jgi:hypothetical protein